VPSEKRKAQTEVHSLVCRADTANYLGCVKGVFDQQDKTTPCTQSS
jgi:hypothetical protein